MSFDPRVVPEAWRALARACQAIAPSELGGGAALAGVYLRHRRTRDLDLFFRDRFGVRAVVDALPSVAATSGCSISIVQDAGGFVRCAVESPAGRFELDLVHEQAPRIGGDAQVVDGVRVLPLEEMRANKVTCLLSRAEPRDLVDLMFLERAGHRVEDDLSLAVQKDAGIDPGVLAWLLGDFPVRPLPEMLEPLEASELRSYRDALRERLRTLATSGAWSPRG